MSKDVFVFEVNQKGFEQHVLLNSHKIPVIVEFMGAWSGPCAIVDEIFSALAREFAEEFIFAKVDIDEHTELREEYKIENVPTIVAFKDGKMVRTEAGELSETEARQLLRDLGVFRKSDLLREQAREKHIAGDTAGAIMLFSEAMKQDPSNTRIAMDMVQIFIDLNELEQAKGLYSKLPDSDKKSKTGMALNGQINFKEHASKTEGANKLQKKIEDNADDFDARFDYAICLIAKLDYTGAMDQLFYILERDNEYRDGAVKEMIITITNMFAPTDNNLAQDFRKRLASTLSN